MNDLEKIERRVKLEETLKNYTGSDRVIYAEDKKAEIEMEKKLRPAFSARTGIPMLDECVDGFRRGQLVVVSGPPKHGKTGLCQTFTIRFTEQGHKCLWFSYELGYEELFEKFPMDKLDFYLPNQLENGNVQWIEEKIIESKQKFGTNIIFIDHLDFLRDTEVLKGLGLNLSAYIGSIVQKIKRIAVEQDVLIFLLTHINKDKWVGKDLPTPDALSESRQIAQLADIVLMVMRIIAEKGSFDIYQNNDAWLGVMANRHNGKTKRIPITFVETTNNKGEFRELVNQEETRDFTETSSKLNQDW